MISLSYIRREETHFILWSQHRNEELLVLQGLFNTPISVDKINKFSVRPPELRHIIKNVGNYYRWFIIKNDRIGRDRLEFLSDECVESSLWIDGIQNQVCLRVKALSEIQEYLESIDILDERNDPKSIMKLFVLKIVNFHIISTQNMYF